MKKLICALSGTKSKKLMCGIASSKAEGRNYSLLSWGNRTGQKLKEVFAGKSVFPTLHNESGFCILAPPPPIFWFNQSQIAESAIFAYKRLREEIVYKNTTLGKRDLLVWLRHHFKSHYLSIVYSIYMCMYITFIKHSHFAALKTFYLEV